MKRSIKILAALAAVFAMSALSVSAASAAAPEFHGVTTPTVFSGEQTEQHVFTTESGTVKCTVATFSGQNATTTSTTATLKPKYEKCTAFGFVGATIDTSGAGHECGFMFHLVAGSSPPTATVDVECLKAGEDITVTAGFCTVHIPQQNGLAHVILENTGTTPNRDIDANITVSGISYTSTSGCINPGTYSTGTYTGKATVKGVGGEIWVA